MLELFFSKEGSDVREVEHYNGRQATLKNDQVAFGHNDDSLSSLRASICLPSLQLLIFASETLPSSQV